MKRWIVSAVPSVPIGPPSGTIIQGLPLASITSAWCSLTSVASTKHWNAFARQSELAGLVWEADHPKVASNKVNTAGFFGGKANLKKRWKSYVKQKQLNPRVSAILIPKLQFALTT